MVFVLQAWLAEINEYAQEDVVIMLLGNKADLGERVIRAEDGERLAKVSYLLLQLESIIKNIFSHHQVRNQYNLFCCFLLHFFFNITFTIHCCFILQKS